MAWCGRLGFGGVGCVWLGITTTSTSQSPDDYGSPRSSN
jgi:hypothetical protein